MTTNLDAVIVSKSAPKESDVDVPVRFRQGGAEVALKVDKAGRSALMTEDKCWKAGLIVSCGNVPVGGSMIAVATLLGYFCGGGVPGGLTGALAVGIPALGVSLSGLACACVGTTIVASGCRTVYESNVKAKFELEEVVVEQPKSETTSPKPAPTAPGGWISFGRWFAGQDDATGFASESSV
ncbi:MAG: hypothetical protein OXF02_02325 [Simkaniaceae bacterium]|nr:hypothetical protein [Simkaniaceae bacterium]